MHQNPDSVDRDRRLPAMLRWTSLLAILSIVTVKCLATFPPAVWFDVDPFFDSSRLVGISVAQSLWIDVVLLVVSALGLMGEILARRGIDGLLLILALIPLPVILYHGGADGSDLWRSGAWLSATVAAATLAHLARDRSMRTIAIGVLLAVLLPLLLRGWLQITVEHDATVAEYNATKERFLAQRGWPPGSPAAQMYERRLSQPDPPGWFTTTNVYGTLMASICIAMIGLMRATIRARTPSGYVGVCALLAIGAAIGVWWTSSLGALGALIVAAGVWAVGTWIMPRQRGMLVIGAVALTLLAVVIRGTLLPEGFADERSVLFRWHYWQAAWDVWMNNLVTGVGPDSFQNAYTQYRVPRNPEEVASAHNVLLDWVATLGLSGIAWIGLLGVWLWRSARVTDDDVEAKTPMMATSRIWGLAALAIAPGALLAISAESFRLDTTSVILRQVGVIGMVAVAAIMAMTVSRIETRGGGGAVKWALACAAVAAVVHSQIEMGFFEVNASMWMWCMVALAGGACRSNRSIMGWVAAAIALGAALWIAVNGAAPARQQHAHMAAAANLFSPTNLPRTSDGQVRIADVLRQREAASARLVEAYEAWPIDPRPLEAAARQLMRTAETPDGAAPLRLLMRGQELAAEAARTHDAASSWNLETMLHMHLAQATDDPSHLEHALAITDRLIERDPQSNVLAARRGDLLWSLGRIDEAREAYMRALERDADFELDPLKQLGAGRVAEIRQRLEVDAE